jgi:hypothetical protein
MTRRSREDLNMTVYSLAYLTSVPFSPADALVLAGKLGYRHTGVRIAPTSPGGDFSPLSTDAAMLRETIARAKDSGATVFDVEKPAARSAPAPSWWPATIPTKAG